MSSESASTTSACSTETGEGSVSSSSAASAPGGGRPFGLGLELVLGMVALRRGSARAVRAVLVLEEHDEALHPRLQMVLEELGQVLRAQVVEERDDRGDTAEQRLARRGIGDGEGQVGHRLLAQGELGLG